MSEELKMRESPERGKEVYFEFQPIRHGIREPVQNRLTALGRKITDAKGAERQAQLADKYDAVKAVGSTTRFKPLETSPTTARSFETASRYAQAIAGNDTLTPRPEARLSYESAILKAPYEHVPIYNAKLSELLNPLGKKLEDFEDLSEEQQIDFSRQAQTAAIGAAFDTTGEDAENWKKEVAGQFADLVEHYIEEVKLLKNRSRVLQPAGTHGGSMEWLLQQALVWNAKDGTEHHGISTSKEFEELGGAFDSSEAYSVIIRTDANGNLMLPLKVEFRNPKRPQGEMHLDSEKVKELAEFFRTLHAEDEKKELQRQGLEGSRATLYKKVPPERK